MEYVIGIDGGGTKTQLVAAGRQMEVLYETTGGGASLTALSEIVVEKNLAELLRRFFIESGLLPQNCVSLCMGASGAGRQESQKRLTEMLRKTVPKVPVQVVTDAQGALAGGTGTGVGIILLAGTGSICYGRNQQGETWRAGGWGHIMGDEGSGYDMARKMLQAVVRQADGRGKPTLLTDLVMEQLELSTIDQLVDKLYDEKKGKSEVAGLAFLCDIAYNRGDRTALRIMREVAASLTDLAVVTAEKLWAPQEPAYCVCAGGLLEKSLYLKEHVREELEKKRPNITVISPTHSAAWGCAELAWGWERKFS